MEMIEPDSQQNAGGLSADQGNELKVSQVRPGEIEPQEAHWLRMDPSIARAVLTKTEQELLGGLAALMRNKVEHEQVARRLAQTHSDIEQARQELDSVKNQVRSAEEEVATRLNEQSRINDEIARVHGELENIRREYDQNTELVSELKTEAAQMRQALAEAQQNLDAVKEAAQSQMGVHREAVAQLTQVHDERSALEQSLVPLREEVDGRIRAREGLIEEAVMLHHHVSDLRERKEAHTAELSALDETHSDLRDAVARLKREHGSLIEQIEALRQTVTQHAGESDRLQRGLNDLHAEIAGRHAEQLRLQQLLAEERTRVGNLLDAKGNLEQSIMEAGNKHRALQADVASLASHLRGLAVAPEKGSATTSIQGLPLLFEAGAQKIAPEWDSYPLESEFHTDEELDAKKVAELVSALPGLDGCMLVRNGGAVLASQLPERLHAHLTVPGRNYQLLFDRFENKVEDRKIENARLATFELGDDALTIAQSDHAFLFANHKRIKLRPGLAVKLAAIVSEVAKMYP
jgi:septal ring factor EnvC (AmiA/AmiB activator)